MKSLAGSWAKILLFSLFLSLGIGCSSTTKAPFVSEKEKIKQDNQYGYQLAEKFQSQLRLKNNLEVSIYLRSVAEKMVAADRILRDSPVGVFTYLERDKEPYKNFALPGNKVYLSIGLVNSLDFEAELASAIAIELAHIKKRHVLLRLEKETGRDTLIGGDENLPQSGVIFLGPGGVFAYNLEENEEAIDEAVGILYAAGFDPRGMFSLLKRFQSNLARAPYDPQAIEKLQDRAREAYSYFAPLRNPGVNSVEFVQMKTRISKI